MLHPTNRHGTKMKYTKLRKFLASDGYTLLNQELYMLVTTSRKTAETHLNRLKEYDPGSGVVRVLRLTEKQYSKMWYLTGDMDYQEKVVGNNEHIIVVKTSRNGSYESYG